MRSLVRGLFNCGQNISFYLTLPVIIMPLNCNHDVSLSTFINGNVKVANKNLHNTCNSYYHLFPQLDILNIT